jgi:hypothetical protein
VGLVAMIILEKVIGGPVTGLAGDTRQPFPSKTPAGAEPHLTDCFDSALSCVSLKPLACDLARRAVLTNGV